jgi:hypothetical protein
MRESSKNQVGLRLYSWTRGSLGSHFKPKVLRLFVTQEKENSVPFLVGEHIHASVAWLFWKVPTNPLTFFPSRDGDCDTNPAWVLSNLCHAAPLTLGRKRPCILTWFSWDPHSGEASHQVKDLMIWNTCKWTKQPSWLSPASQLSLPKVPGTWVASLSDPLDQLIYRLNATRWAP